jgi:molecular chaperone DnaK (HSP70)
MNEKYYLAVDVGTSRVAAATARLAPDGSISTAPFPLGRRTDSAATVVFVADDGEYLFADAAERRGVTQPDRLIREFKRSVGDEVPLMVGGRAIPAEQLYAHTVASVIETVSEREGARPAAVMLTHPAAWGPHRIGLIRSALAAVGVTDVELITEPEAAARHYEASRPVQVGHTLAVYDLGGGTFDSVILRKESDDSFELVGKPIGIDNLGGADFDDAVLRHVLRSAQASRCRSCDASASTRKRRCRSTPTPRSRSCCRLAAPASV